MPAPRSRNQKGRREKCANSKPKAVEADAVEHTKVSWPARDVDEEPDDIFLHHAPEECSKPQKVENVAGVQPMRNVHEKLGEICLSRALDEELNAFGPSSPLDEELDTIGLSRALEEYPRPLSTGVAENFEDSLPQAQSMDAKTPVEEDVTCPGKALDVSRMPSNSSLFTTAREGDLKVAESIANSRGLPPDIEPESVRKFLLQYSYNSVDHQYWAKSTEDRPELSISLSNHIEFGDHTQYELICKVLCRDGSEEVENSWRTLRRLKHIRVGLHDPVKKALGSRYNHFFGKTPFAHYTAPSGSTARLREWFASLAGCINSYGLAPHLVAKTLRLLDGPGTPLYAHGKLAFSTSCDFEKIPVTAAMFGSKHCSAHQGQGPSHDQMDVKGGQKNGLSFYQGTADTGIFEMTFDVKGQERKVQILQRPLGAEFSKRPSEPLHISNVKPGSHAEELGLQIGWAVTSVGAEDVSEMRFQQTQDVIKAALMRLPFPEP